MKTVNRYKIGVGFLISGYRVIGRDRLLKWYSLLPFGICLICFMLGIAWGGQQIPLFVDQVMAVIFGASVEGWLTYLVVPFKFLFELLTFLIYGILLLYIIFLTASVIASPFNSLIAERVLVVEGILPERPFQMGRWIKISLKMMWVALIRAFILLAFVPILFVCSFIPGLNVVAAFFAFLLLAFDVADFSLEVLEYSLRDRFSHLKKNMPEFSGMATIFAATAMVPGLTLFVMPLSVAGAAKVLAHIENESKRPVKA